MINNRLVYISIILSGICLCLLIICPEWDIKFSQVFYNYYDGFIYRDNIVVRFLFLLIPPTTNLFVISCSILFLIQLFMYKKFKKVPSLAVTYLLITALVGPGLVVNIALKETFGRARPSQITEFGGVKHFTQATKITDQCKHNCSFSSGHAAMAYYYTALSYCYSLSNKDKKIFTIIYIIALLFGTLTGFSRILMGGHFLSDVVASCFIILSINHLLFLCWKNKRRIT